MKKNVGTLDQIFRFIFGLLFIILFFSGSIRNDWGIALLLIGGIFVITSAIKICPIYSIFGISSCTIKNSKPIHGKLI